jgi:hypothetical protein
MQISNTSLHFSNVHFFLYIYVVSLDDDDDDVYLRLQNVKRFYNLIYISYVKHINSASKA